MMRSKNPLSWTRSTALASASFSTFCRARCCPRDQQESSKEATSMPHLLERLAHDLLVKLLALAMASSLNASYSQRSITSFLRVFRMPIVIRMPPEMLQQTKKLRMKAMRMCLESK